LEQIQRHKPGTPAVGKVPLWTLWNITATVEKNILEVYPGLSKARYKNHIEIF
jgi:hypothetical protein